MSSDGMGGETDGVLAGGHHGGARRRGFHGGLRAAERPLMEWPIFWTILALAVSYKVMPIHEERE